MAFQLRSDVSCFDAPRVPDPDVGLCHLPFPCAAHSGGGMDAVSLAGILAYRKVSVTNSHNHPTVKIFH
jgi:hypothetical protein